MGNTFNSGFYITVAALVPLLYISLFLQSQSMQDLSKRIGEAYGKRVLTLMELVIEWFHLQFRRRQVWTFIKLLFFIVYGLVPTIAVIIALTFAGPVAAGYSLYALFYGSDVGWMRVTTLLLTMGLLVLVSSFPIMIVVRNLFAPQLEARNIFHRRNRGVKIPPG